MPSTKSKEKSSSVLSRESLRAWLSGALLVALLAGAGAEARVGSTSEPRSAGALRSIATAFNDHYTANQVGAVYDRFDAASRAVISRAAYVARHRECPDPPGAATVTSVAPGSGGYWLVHYEISGVTMTDYWHYVSGRWLFSLVKSNPSAVALYRLPYGAYARAVGCASGS